MDEYERTATQSAPKSNSLKQYCNKLLLKL